MTEKAVIFDLDGTLMHTLPDIHKSINIMLEMLGYEKIEYQRTCRGLNRGSRYLVANALPKGIDDGSIDHALEVYKSIYAEHYGDTTLPYAGVYDVVKRLKDAHCGMAVLSNKPDAFTRGLVENHFGGLFDVVVGQGKYPVKPSPEAPTAIASALGVTPEDVIFVGDSDVDMETARRAGMRSVGVVWGYRDRELLEAAGAGKIAATPDELYEIIMNY